MRVHVIQLELTVFNVASAILLKTKEISTWTYINVMFVYKIVKIIVLLLKENAVAVASVHLPQSVFSQSSAWQSVDNSTCKLQFIVFRNGKLFPSTGNSSNLADDGKRRTVATPAVFAKIDGCSFGNLTSPLTIGLRHFARGVDPVAAFWDFDLLDGHGGWWGEGCHIISSAGNITTVQSTHFSNFAVLMDFKTVLSFPQYPGEFLHPVVYACTAVMLLCLFASIITYIVHHSKLLNYRHTVKKSNVTKVGIVLHYSTLSTMLWIGVTARNIYKQVTKKPQPCQNSDQPSYPKQPLLRFYLISGGVPFIICGITAATNINNYGIEGNAPYCWMAWEPSLGAFYGPVAFIVLVTCVYFLCTYVQLKRHPERKYELKEKTEDPQRIPSTEDVYALTGATLTAHLLLQATVPLKDLLHKRVTSTALSLG
ncbi:hypothetical protein llap_6151 [Limosa lapponica baueri]|uniref:G-protein coupled receptors family 2 profile 2 domain-containing protein n=1 Tax=Limosa lapponica baueri TaxID=1758121 RepID=A0A2I0UBV3_LIMLA|nr:hypothetical protein llap_6151 [Limosa lapponica baueri]